MMCKTLNYAKNRTVKQCGVAVEEAKIYCFDDFFV